MKNQEQLYKLIWRLKVIDFAIYTKESPNSFVGTFDECMEKMESVKRSHQLLKFQFAIIEL